MSTVKLWCGVYGEGTVFAINIDREARVNDLKAAIISMQGFSTQARKLTFYLARNEKGEWLEDDAEAKHLLLGPVSPKYQEMWTSKRLDGGQYSRPNILVPKDKISILVDFETSGLEIPAANKLTHINDDLDKSVSLKGLWRYSELNLAKLPPSDELGAILQRNLPFQFRLTEIEKIFPKGGQVTCDSLAELINRADFATKAPWELSNESRWDLYSLLMKIPIQICGSKGIKLTRMSDEENAQVLVQCGALELLRLEQGGADTDLNVLCSTMLAKMQWWSPMVYGELPYILGFLSSGRRLCVVAIDRDLHASTIVEFDSIFEQKAEVVVMFYNLAFLLESMVALSRLTGSGQLLPFTSARNNKRTLEVVNGSVIRKIEAKDCSDLTEFDRLRDIFHKLRR